MNQNVPASFGLSVLTVMFFAVVLYQPDPPPSQAGPVEKTAVSDPRVSAATKASEVEVLTPARVATKPPVSLPAPLAREARPAGTPVAVLVERRTPTTPARPVSRREASEEAPKEPKGAFTQARAGEALIDVARRVYGTEDEAKALWLANRDVLDRADVPLRPGMLLRTP